MRKFFYLFSMLMAGIIMGGTAYAQCPDLPNLGDEYICHFVNGQKVVVLPGGPAPANSDGRATVRVIGFNYNPCQVIFQVIDFNSNGIGEFGTLDSRLVPTAKPTTLTGDPANGTLFPAELDLNLELEATSTALGGNTYRSVGALNLRASGVNSLPLQGVNVQQTEPVEFYGPGGADDTFILENTHVNLNP